MSYKKTGFDDFVLTCDKCGYRIHFHDEHWLRTLLTPAISGKSINYGHWHVDSVDPKTGEAKHICPYCIQEARRAKCTQNQKQSEH